MFGVNKVASSTYVDGGITIDSDSTSELETESKWQSLTRARPTRTRSHSKVSPTYRTLASRKTYGPAGSARTVAEFFEYSVNTILFQRGVYPAEDFTPVKKYGLNMLISSDDQVKAYIKKIISQLNKWMLKSKISKFVVVVTSKETGEHVERWQFDVQVFGKAASKKSSSRTTDKENADPK